MESEEHPPEETHPDEPAGNGEPPSEGEYEAERRDDPPSPEEGVEQTPAEDLVERARGSIHDATDSESKPPATTTDSGILAPSDEYSLTAGPAGPTVLHDHYLVQKMQHFNRERVPERVVHAKGTGAHGFFEVTEDVTAYTKASLFAQVGKRTPMFARFSTVAGEQGFADSRHLR